MRDGGGRGGFGGGGEQADGFVDGGLEGTARGGVLETVRGEDLAGSEEGGEEGVLEADVVRAEGEAVGRGEEGVAQGEEAPD